MIFQSAAPKTAALPLGEGKNISIKLMALDSNQECPFRRQNQNLVGYHYPSHQLNRDVCGLISRLDSNERPPVSETGALTTYATGDQTTYLRT